MFGSVVSLAMFYIKGRERDTEAFSFLRSLIYANLSFFLIGLNSGSTLLFIASIWLASLKYKWKCRCAVIGDYIASYSQAQRQQYFQVWSFFLQNIENIEHIVASYSQAQRQQYFQVLILSSFSSFLSFCCFSSFFLSPPSPSSPPSILFPPSPPSPPYIPSPPSPLSPPSPPCLQEMV